MTSPGINKPSQNTNGRYEGVYSKGSSFGQGLNEARVREILSTEVKSPFGRLIDRISDRFNEFAGDIASAIRKDKGAKYEVISGAVDDRLGPIDTAISESGNRMVELSDKVDEQIREQDRISKEQAETLVRVDAYASEAEKNRKDLDAYEAQRKQDLVVVTAKAQKGIDDAAAYRKAMEDADKAIRTDVQTALRSAESAQKSADGKSTNYYGTTAPKSPVNGDTWFKPVTGGTQLLQYSGGKWVEVVDTAASDKRLAEARKAVDDTSVKVAELSNTTLPELERSLSGKIDDERTARSNALGQASRDLSLAKQELGKSIQQNKDKLASTEKTLAAAQNSVKNLVEVDLPAVKKTTSGLSDKLAQETQTREQALRGVNESLANTKSGLDQSMGQLQKGLAKSNDDLGQARKELDTLNLTRPGNLFPDPHFGDARWGVRRANPGLKIVAVGKQTGAYYPWAFNDPKSGIQFEPGAAYLLTVDLQFEAGSDISHLAIYTTGPDAREGSRTYVQYQGAIWKNAGNDGQWATGTLVVRTPDYHATGGNGSLGFYVQGNFKTGFVVVDNVRLFRAADNSLVVDGAITAGKIQAGAVETAKLAADAVTADKIAANQILAKHVKANEINASHIAAGTITSNEIGANQIKAVNIATDAITARHIAANAVEANHIKANQITGDKLTANAITSREVSANSIMAEHLVVGGPANLIANGSFTEGSEPWDTSVLTVKTIGSSQKLPPGNRYAITNPGQQTASVHTGNQWMTVTPNELYAFEVWLYADKPNSVFYLDLRDQYGAMAGKSTGKPVNSSDRLAAASGAARPCDNIGVATGWNKYSVVYQMGPNVTRVKLGSFYFNHPNGSETGAVIAFAGISLRPMASADLIVDGAILANHIKAGQITGDKLVADAITSREIKAGQVTTRELATDAVTADKIKSGEITGDKIRANTITGENILANSVTANELQIRPGNIFPDPDFQDPCWGTSGSVYAHSNNGGELRFYPNGGQIGKYYQPAGFADRSFMLENGAQYKLTATVWSNDADNGKGTISVYTRYIKRDNTVGIYRVGLLPVGGTATSTQTTILTMPSDMKDGLCTIGFFVERNLKAGQISVWNIQMVRAADASLVVDGAISAKKIEAGAITSRELATDAVIAKHIKAGEITTKELAAGVLTSDNLTVRDGFIKTAMIGDGQITNAKMGSLDAGKITSGTLDAKRIGADSITVKELRANTIIPIGGSLIHHEPPPDDPTKPPQPIWWQACDLELAADYSGWPRPEGNPWRTATSAQGKGYTTSVPKRLVKVKAGQPYKLKVWLKATKAGSKMFIDMRNQDGALPKITGAPYTGNTAVKWYNDSANGWDVADFTGTTRTGSYLLDNYTVHTYPTLVTSTVVFDPGTDYVYLNRIYFNHPNGSEQTANQWIAGLSLELDIPNQADVDAAQNRAIEANTMAVKMLGRIDPGSLLVDYLTPSEADLKTPGKEVNWAIPQWTTACTRTGSSGGIQWWGYSGAKTAKEATKLFRPVIPDQEYKLTFEAKGPGQLTMAVATEGDGWPVLSSRRVVSRSSTSVPVYEDQKVDGNFVVRGTRLSSDWDTYTYLVKFGSGTTSACISSIWWNDDGGSRAQYIRNLEFRPNIMTQKEVDDAQTAAIRSLESFELQQNDLNESQRKTNRLVQAQTWMHQDLIELLDIRTPKTYGWPATTGGQSYCPAAAQNGYYISTPYYEQWEVGDGKDSSVYIYCRGQWTGWIVASINWDSGVTDEWSVEVTKTNRIFRFTGGAYHIKKRFIGMTVYPRSLNRTASISRVENPEYTGWSGSYSTSRWDGIWDPNKLFRVSYTAGIRLKNTVVCDKSVWVRDENNRQTGIYAGKPIYAAVIYPEDQIYMGPYTFTEVDDPVPQDDRTGYSINSARPSGRATTYSSHVN